MKRAVLFGLGVMFAGGCDDDGVRVNEPVELDILEHVVAAAAGSAHALNVHVAGVTPDSVRYRSADSSVARVDGRVVTGVAPGVAWVHAYVETRTSVRDSVAVIVTAQPLSAGPLLRVSPATVSLYNGKRRIVRGRLIRLSLDSLRSTRARLPWRASTQPAR